MVIINKGKTNLYIKKAMSFTVDYPDSNYKLLKLAGTWARERFVDISVQSISAHTIFFFCYKNWEV